jgi:hypothetical protein
MSNVQYAFLDKTRVPDRAALQASIDALGFDVKLHPDFTPFTDEGFSPCVLGGEAGPGFEIYYQTASEATDDDEEVLAVADGRDYCISMVWRGSMKDLACVMIVSCALARDSGAVISYEGDDPSPLDELIASTKDILADAAAEQ